MTNETIYKHDVENRFPQHTLKKTINGSIVKYVLENDGALIAYGESPDAGSAIFQLREKMGLGIEIPPLLTHIQRDNLTDIIQGQPILTKLGTGVHVQSFHDGTAWKTITHT